MKFSNVMGKYLWPAKGKGWQALLRLLIVATLVIVFRFEVLAWLVAGHNLLWKAVTRSPRNNPADMEYLSFLRMPGVRMLLWFDECSTLARISDPEVIPALCRVVGEHPDIATRINAIAGLSSFKDERVMDVGTRALSDSNPKIRLAAARLFADLGEERHLSLIRRAAGKETAPEVRTALLVAERLIAPRDEPVSSRTVRVAAVQCVSEFGVPEENRRKLSAMIREAAGQGAKIVVLPETAIQGYMSLDAKTGWLAPGHTPVPGVGGSPAGRVAELVNGPSTECFCKLARELGLYVTVPFLETDPTRTLFYNSVCLIDPSGEILLHYRKINPWPYGEQGWTTRGDRGLQVADTPYGRLGLLICYDINFEAFNLHAKGVDTLLYSIAWVDRPLSPWFDVGLPRLARESNMNIVGANWTIPRYLGWHGYGHTRIISRSGRVLARADSDMKEQIVYADIPVPGR